MAFIFSDAIKTQIFGKHRAGKSMKEIIDILGASQADVQCVLEQFHEEGDINTKPWSNRPHLKKNFQFQHKIWLIA